MNKPIPFGQFNMPHIPLSLLSPVRANSRSFTNKMTIEIGPLTIDGPFEVCEGYVDKRPVKFQAARRLHRGDYLTIFPYELKFRLPKN